MLATMRNTMYMNLKRPTLAANILWLCTELLWYFGTFIMAAALAEYTKEKTEPHGQMF
jgi:hypothetical protein